MKMPFTLAAALMIGGCASGGGIVGVKTSSGASGVMLTSRPAAQVAQCLAGALDGNAQPDGAGYTITVTGSLAAEYRIRSFEDKLRRYATIVEISGSMETPKGTQPALCLSSGNQGT